MQCKGTVLLGLACRPTILRGWLTDCLQTAQAPVDKLSLVLFSMAACQQGAAVGLATHAESSLRNPCTRRLRAKLYIMRQRRPRWLTRCTVCQQPEHYYRRENYTVDCHKPVTMVQFYNLWWVGVCVAGVEILFYIFCYLNCLLYRNFTGMPALGREKRQRVSCLLYLSFCVN